MPRLCDCRCSYGKRVSRALRVLAGEGAESNKHFSSESCLQDNWIDNYAKSEAFKSKYQAVTAHEDGQQWPNQLTKEDGNLYRNGKLLVPEARMLEFMKLGITT